MEPAWALRASHSILPGVGLASALPIHAGASGHGALAQEEPTPTLGGGVEEGKRSRGNSCVQAVARRPPDDT